MSRYYNIPNKVNLPIAPHGTHADPLFACKSKAPLIIENEKKIGWPSKSRYPNISNSQENTPPRRIPSYRKLHKPWQTVVKTTVARAGTFIRSQRSRASSVAIADSRLMFNFIDANTDSRLSYLEFRSWMLIIDSTLAEHELLTLFNEIDRNGTPLAVALASTLIALLMLGDGFIQYKEFRDYFGDELLTGEANVVELTTLFNEIDTARTGTISLEQLLAFFNRHTAMISEEEAHLFLGMASDIGNENCISLRGKPHRLAPHSPFERLSCRIPQSHARVENLNQFSFAFE